MIGYNSVMQDINKANGALGVDSYEDDFICPQSS